MNQPSTIQASWSQQDARFSKGERDVAVRGMQVSCWPRPIAALAILWPPGKQSLPSPESGWLWGCCDLHPPLQRLPQQPTQARCETLPETHFSILYSDVLSPLPMRDMLTQKENPGWYFLRKGETIAHEFFCKVNAQDLKPQTDYHPPAAGHTTSSNGDSSWNNSTWQLDFVLLSNCFLHRGRYFSSGLKAIYLQTKTKNPKQQRTYNKWKGK